MDEIFDLVQREISVAGFAKKLSAGIVVTGGAAQMPGVVELASDVFSTGVRRGLPGEQSPHLVTGLSDSVEAPRFATVVGLAVYGANRLLAGALAPDYTRLRARGVHRLGRRLATWFSDFF
jgi:cell division protein FtsA